MLAAARAPARHELQLRSIAERPFDGPVHRPISLAAPMDWLGASDYWLTRLVFQRALAAIYLVAFLVAVNQFRPLLGEHGLLPVPDFIRAVPFRRSPSLFYVRYSDRILLAVAWTGFALAAGAIVGAPDLLPLPLTMAWWAALWALYLSIVNVGQTFYAFGWESLLCETGFLAIFLGPASVTPFFPLIVLLRWLLFRVEFGAGLIKMRGDRCWRDLTCLYYHHETQPMPNPLSWYFHHLPKRLHRHAGVAAPLRQLLVAQRDHDRARYLRFRRRGASPSDPVRTRRPRASGALPRACADRHGAHPAAQLPPGAEPGVTPPADELQLRSAPHRRDVRRLRFDHQRAVRDRHRGHGRAAAHRANDVAGVRVQRKARRRPPPPAPVRAVSPAARLADVVRGHELADVPRVVHAAARKAAR